MKAAAKRPSEAYAEGSQARANDAPAKANPYSKDSKEFAAWDKGWQGANPSLQDVSPDALPPVETPTG